MKKIAKRVVALLLVLTMALMFSACATANDGTVCGKMIDFWLNGWDGIFEVHQRAQYVRPVITVRRHAIRENHKATQKHTVGTSSGYVSYGYGVASTDGPDE